MVSPVSVSLRQPVVKIVLISIGLLFLLVVLLNIYLDPLIRTLFTQEMTPLFGDNLAVESIHLSIPYGLVILKSITLRQPPGFGEDYAFKAGFIKMRIKLSELFHRKLIIEQIAIIKPQLHLIQHPTGRLNFDYYAEAFRKSADKPGDQNGEPFHLYLKQLQITKGEFILSSDRLSRHQPAMTLNDLELKISEFKLPNPNRENAPFVLSGSIVAPHPAHFDVNGNGVFLSGTLSYSANSQFTGLHLSEYTDLFPPSDWTIQRGIASVTAQTQCHNNYLISHQHVKIVDLKIAPKSMNRFKSAFFGLPSQAMVALLKDQNGVLDFSFDVQGSPSHLKVYLKESISQAILRSLSKKVKGYGENGGKTINKLKEGGQKLKRAFKKFFHK